MKKILIVEDERITAMYNAYLLKKYGYKSICVHTGEDAIRIALSDNDISLILMDIDLGKGINGIHAAEKIYTERLLPIIFLSHNINLEEVKRIEAFIPYGFVSKSSNENILIISIITAMRIFDNYMGLLQKIVKIYSKLN